MVLSIGVSFGFCPSVSDDGVAAAAQAGAFAVVPEILEPSLQLAAAVLRELKMPAEEVAASLEDFRRLHLSELKALCDDHGSSMGYGFAKDPKDEGEAAKDSPASKDAPAPA